MPNSLEKSIHDDTVLKPSKEEIPLTLIDLDDLVLSKIFYFLELKDFLATSKVCVRFYKLNQYDPYWIQTLNQMTIDKILKICKFNKQIISKKFLKNNEQLGINKLIKNAKKKLLDGKSKEADVEAFINLSTLFSKDFINKKKPYTQILEFNNSLNNYAHKKIEINELDYNIQQQKQKILLPDRALEELWNPKLWVTLGIVLTIASVILLSIHHFKVNSSDLILGLGYVASATGVFLLLITALCAGAKLPGILKNRSTNNRITFFQNQKIIAEQSLKEIVANHPSPSNEESFHDTETVLDFGN